MTWGFLVCCIALIGLLLYLEELSIRHGRVMMGLNIAIILVILVCGVLFFPNRIAIYLPEWLKTAF